MQQVFSLTLAPANLPDNRLGYTGLAYVSPKNYKSFANANNGKEPVYVIIKTFIFTLGYSNGIDDKSIGLGKFPRTFMKISLTDSLIISNFIPKEDIEYRLSSLIVDVALGLSLKKEKLEVEEKDLEQDFRKTYSNQFFAPGQQVLQSFDGNVLILTV